MTKHLCDRCGVECDLGSRLDVDLTDRGWNTTPASAVVGPPKVVSLELTFEIDDADTPDLCEGCQMAIIQQLYDEVAGRRDERARAALAAAGEALGLRGPVRLSSDTAAPGGAPEGQA
jgi:hypothetical protein